MDVDIFTIGAFVAIATVIWLTMWTDYRNAQEKRQRLEKFQRQVLDAHQRTVSRTP